MIDRSPGGAASHSYDLIVVGGGAYGVALALESARRGLRPLLLERGDYGGETSANSLGVVHGGLRYLQSLDLRRFRTSVAEQSWFLRHFPDLVQPLDCLMPLYGRGLRRRSVFGVALWVDRLLSSDRNAGLRADRQIRRGRTLSASEVVARCPQVERAGLQGGALWSDGAITSPARLWVEMLRWAVSCGARCLNYVEAEVPLVDRGTIVGVRARDRIDGASYEFRGPVVVNCAGPWCGELAAEWDSQANAARLAPLFLPAIALNVELRLSDSVRPEWRSIPALAVSPPDGSKAYFIRPMPYGVLAGTYHAPWQGPYPNEAPPELVERFVEELWQCLPALADAAPELRRVLWGMLPATGAGSAQPSTRLVFRDHGAAGGSNGLFSVSGVKLTTARSVAERTLRSLMRRAGAAVPPLLDATRPSARVPIAAADLETLMRVQPVDAEALVREIVQRESVVRLDDLLMRRTDWGADPDRSAGLRRTLETMLGVDADGTLSLTPVSSTPERAPND